MTPRLPLRNEFWLFEHQPLVRDPLVDRRGRRDVVSEDPSGTDEIGAESGDYQVVGIGGIRRLDPLCCES